MAMARQNAIYVWDTQKYNQVCKIPASAGRTRGSFRCLEFVVGSSLIVVGHSNGRLEALDVSEFALGADFLE